MAEYEFLSATSEVPCRICGGDTIPPQPRWGEEHWYCEPCGELTVKEAK